ncbi:MAG: hypothetical protein LKF98_01585, partial [Microbacteriaceae bacterium]|nr:hypothetical protein [Microbacteriaceae bacterium]
AQINGRAVVTIEAKSSSDVTKIANIVKRMGLQESCMINTSDPAVVPSIVNTGMYAHVWCWDDVSKIPTAIANGAHFIEVPYNASASIVSECQAAVNDSSKNLAYFVAGPISTRAERDAITPGIMGHVTDALGMTNRAGSTRLLKTIAPSLAAGKRGVGWRVYKGAYDNLRGLTDSGDKTLTINPGGIIVSGNASYSHCNLYLGDLSGTPSTSYTVKLKFIPAAGMAGTGARIGLRVASEDADKSGTDVDTRGYEVALRGNGQLVAWSCPGGAVGTPLGTFPTGAALTSGATYEVDVAITASTVTVKRVGTGDSISASNTDHRGGNIYLTTDSYSDGNCDGSQIVGIEIS